MSKIWVLLLFFLTGCQIRQPETTTIKPLYHQHVGSLSSKYQQNIDLDKNHCKLEYQNGDRIDAGSYPVRCNASWLSEDYKQQARFDGQIAIDENVVILSDEKKLELNLSEVELNTFDKNIEYIISTNKDEIIGKGIFEAINYRDETMYTVTFKHDVPLNKIKYEKMSVYITDPKPYYVVPLNYVSESDGQLFIQTDDQKIPVEGELFYEYYIINKGVSGSLTLVEYVE